MAETRRHDFCTVDERISRCCPQRVVLLPSDVQISSVTTGGGLSSKVWMDCVLGSGCHLNIVPRPDHRKIVDIVVFWAVSGS